MTSLALSEVLAPAQTAGRPGTATVPAASEEAIRLALQLRGTRVSSGGRLLLFVPAPRSHDASFAVADALCGLLELQEGPVLVMDTRAVGAEEATPAWLRELPDDRARTGERWGTSGRAMLARPFANRGEKVFSAASPEFANWLAEVRLHYAYVLCIGGGVPTSVETLMLAPLADGVVLTVAPGRTTRLQMRRLTDQLRRAQAHLIGFVADARPSQDGTSGWRVTLRVRYR